jgi:hypothetical protein
MTSLPLQTSSLWCSSILILYEAGALLTSWNWGTCFSRKKKVLRDFIPVVRRKCGLNVVSKRRLSTHATQRWRRGKTSDVLIMTNAVCEDWLYQRPSNFPFRKNVGDTFSQPCDEQRVRRTWRVSARGGKTFPVPINLIWTAVRWTDILQLFKFHCFTVRFNSLINIYQLRHTYIIIYRNTIKEIDTFNVV